MAKGVIYAWDKNNNQYVKIPNYFASSSGGSGGTSDHSALVNRNIANQHDMSAINGLVEELNSRPDTAMTTIDIDAILI